MCDIGRIKITLSLKLALVVFGTPWIQERESQREQRFLYFPGEGISLFPTVSSYTNFYMAPCSWISWIRPWMNLRLFLRTWITLLQNSSDVRKDTSSGNVAHSPLSKEYQSSDGISREVGRSEYSALSPVANTWNVITWEKFPLATMQSSASWINIWIKKIVVRRSQAEF